MRYISWLIVCVLVSSLTLAQDPPTFVTGPAEDILLIDDFTADSAGAWTAKMGSNVTHEIEAGYAIPGVATSLMRIRGSLKDPNDREAGHNWFAISKEKLDPRLPADTTGLRIQIGELETYQWWVQVALKTEEGTSYSYVIADQTFPAGRIVEFMAPLERFRSAEGKPLTSELAPAITSVSVVTGLGNRTVYLDKITAYRQQRLGYWLDYTTSHPSDNLFERGEQVEIVFTPGGKVPPATTGLRYEIRDYYEKIAGAGTCHPERSEGSGYFAALRMTTEKIQAPSAPGYYEVTAYLIDGAGQDLEQRSCIRAEGSVPAGLGTYAVTPRTVEENLALFRRVGQDAFFGLHGDFHNLADRLGLSWRMGYSAWRWLEPTKPDRTQGPAEWAAKALASEPMPPYRFHLQPFLFNLRGGFPEWAQGDTPRAPAFRDWEDALAHLRDHVRVERHLYPHMRPRLYGGAWEINLNMPPYVSNQPEFTPEDVVELYRRVREVVKQEDPEGQVMGPCPSVLDLDWFETVFKAGVLQYLDAIETHAYNHGAYTPEENDTPGKLARLNELVRRYNKGKTLPIYCTERGETGVIGARPIYREQARHMVRGSIIMKGEGVKVFFPFYGIDFDPAGYGLLFNLEIDAPSGPWHTRRVTPKPMVSTMATCAQLLEGTKPAGRITSLGQDVWAYRFTRGDTTIIPIWTTGAARTIKLPVGAVKSVEVVDIIGRSSRMSAANAAIRIAIDDSPRYVMIGEGR